MTIFALELMEVPDREEQFYKLFVNGECLLEASYEEMRKAGNHQKDLDKIQTLIELLSQGQGLPADKFKELQGRKKNDIYRDFEIKAGRLRVYLFEDIMEGKIIVLGELKKDVKRQNRKIEEMRAIKLK